MPPTAKLCDPAAPEACAAVVPLRARSGIRPPRLQPPAVLRPLARRLPLRPFSLPLWLRGGAGVLLRRRPGVGAVALLVRVPSAGLRAGPVLGLLPES